MFCARETIKADIKYGVGLQVLLPLETLVGIGTSSAPLPWRSFASTNSIGRDAKRAKALASSVKRSCCGRPRGIVEYLAPALVGGGTPRYAGR